MLLVVVLLISDLVVSYTTGRHTASGPVPHVSAAHSEIAKLYTSIASFCYLSLLKGFERAEQIFPMRFTKGSVFILVSNSGERPKPGDRRQMASEIGNLSWILAV